MLINFDRQSSNHSAEISGYIKSFQDGNKTTDVSVINCSSFDVNVSYVDASGTLVDGGNVKAGDLGLFQLTSVAVGFLVKVTAAPTTANSTVFEAVYLTADMPECNIVLEPLTVENF